MMGQYQRDNACSTSSRAAAASAIGTDTAVPAAGVAALAAAFAVALADVAEVPAAPVPAPDPSHAVAASLLLLLVHTWINDSTGPTACPDASANATLRVVCHLGSKVHGALPERPFKRCGVWCPQHSNKNTRGSGDGPFAPRWKS